MAKRVLAAIAIGTSLLLGLTAAVLGAGQTDVVQDVTTMIDYTDPATGVATTASVDCDVVVRIEADDGSARELNACTLSDDQPAGPVTAPATPITVTGGQCAWASDYWATKDGSQVIAASYELTVTPSGQVFVWSEYPAEFGGTICLTE